ncbi:DoxX family protein [Xylanimonas cellulosilytica DSM 15894]|uniref:DoxX family protein n=1 Tax=Xylanimonas cellulosilytica (strain DSM 15894 / JCM 12276 / CECT 5975 / KCTC 9989 / LMG 20990 / NBRC 107835 / XIL07) TaxID=446471 RepID=D1BWG3_XYLCX|nr:DoxX family membrane protein [Xylanimonas cellulosilytica]ACZ31508.1 DoxX family protein [Xylanimonas cellulosilytica DSM 15894]
MLLRRVARPLLAAPFVFDGVQAALHPAEHVAAARGLTDQVTDRVGVKRLTDQQLTLAVRAHGGLTAALGVALAAGFFPRLASLNLAALTVPLAVVHQPFAAKGAERTEKTGRFVRAAGYVGAALIAGVDTEGRPGVSWRVGQARKKAVAKVESVRENH